MLPRGERPNPLREKNAAVNGFLRSSLPRLGQQAQYLDVSREFVHSDGTIIPQDMFDFLHLTSTGYRSIAKPLSDLLLQILEETPEERRASLVWGPRPSSTFIQRHVSPAAVGRRGRHVPGICRRKGSLTGERGTLMWVGPRGVWVTFMSGGLGVEVLKRERDVITDVDTVIAVVTSIAKGFAKAKLLWIIDILRSCGTTVAHIRTA